MQNLAEWLASRRGLNALNGRASASPLLGVLPSSCPTGNHNFAQLSSADAAAGGAGGGVAVIPRGYDVMSYNVRDPRDYRPSGVIEHSCDRWAVASHHAASSLFRLFSLLRRPIRAIGFCNFAVWLPGGEGDHEYWFFRVYWNHRNAVKFLGFAIFK